MERRVGQAEPVPTESVRLGKTAARFPEPLGVAVVPATVSPSTGEGRGVPVAGLTRARV